MTQIKGDGETHPFLSPNDEFANFERWDKGNLDLTVPRSRKCFEFEYARSALMNGLKLEAGTGVNPYKFGMIGSTDAHTALATADEDNFFGKTSSSEPSPDRATHPFVKTPTKLSSWAGRQTASGYAGGLGHRKHARGDLRRDGAPRNLCHDRPAHGRALLRRLGLHAADATSRTPATAGYTKGVPMGGDLGAAPDGKAPSFLVAALKDPIGANLDRYPDRQGLARRQGRRAREGL